MNVEKMLIELNRYGLTGNYSTESNMFQGIWDEKSIHGKVPYDNELLSNIFYIINKNEMWHSHVLCGQKTICIRSTQDFTLAGVSIKSYFSLVKRSNLTLGEFSGYLKDCIDAGFRVEINSDQTIEFHRETKESESIEKIWLTDDLKWRLEQVNQENHNIQGKTHESLRDAISSLLSI